MNAPVLNFTLSMVIFGTIGLFVVEGAQSAFVTVFWRCVFASLFLAAWCMFKGYLRLRDLSGWLMFLAAIGGLCNFGSSVALTAAYSSTTVATATIIYHVQPFFVVMIGAVFLKQGIASHELAWIFVAFVGTALATGFVGQQEAVTSDWAFGVAIALLAALLYAIGTILGTRLGAQRPEVTTLIQVVVVSMFLAPLADITNPVPAISLIWLAGLGVIHTGIAYTLMFQALPKLSTATIGVLAFLFPLVTVLADWIYFSAPITSLQAVGMALIMLGSLGVQLAWGGNVRKPIAPDSRDSSSI